MNSREVKIEQIVGKSEEQRERFFKVELIHVAFMEEAKPISS